MLGQLCDGLIDVPSYVAESIAELLRAHHLGEVVVCPRLEALAEHDLDPGIEPEQLVGGLVGKRVLAEELDAF